jgi:type IV pilus assembly protein PilA
MRQEGFTLIELMIVVAILAILAAVSIPLFRSYIKKADNASAISDLRNIRTLMESYYADNKEYPPL